MIFWLGSITVLGEIFMPWLLYVLAPGFAGNHGKFALAVVLTRIMFPYLFFVCLAALFSGVLNAMGRFAAAAAAPVLFNVILHRLHAAADARTWPIPAMRWPGGSRFPAWRSFCC